MNQATILITASIAIASSFTGCAGSGRGAGDSYALVKLAEGRDPLAPNPTVVPWNPPRQMAAYVHPHEDRRQGILIGGHWIFMVLGNGSWYFEDVRPKEPVPDAEASAEEKRRALRALDLPHGSVIPYAPGGEKSR